MKSMVLAGAAAVGALFLFSTPAAAANGDYLGGCSPTADVSPDASKCYGFVQGNFNWVDLSDVETAFGVTGLTKLQEITFNDGDSSTIIDFVKSLTGPTVISFHWGGGKPAPVKVSGGTTAFYLFDLAGDTTFTQSYGALSNAVLWKTSEPCVGAGCDNGGNSVPEPATWAMMIIGFGGVGAVMRRRRYGAFAA